MRVQLFLGAWAFTGSLILLYIVWGTVSDIVRRALERRKRRVLATLSVLLFDSEKDAAEAHEQIGRLPRRTMLAVIQTLAVDLEGQAHERLRQLTQTSGLHRFIVRRAKSRRWRMRVQAAQLQYLVRDPNFDSRRLLHDRHPLVRARAVESLDADRATLVVDDLLELLGDSSIAVRHAAEQKILDVGVPAVPALQRHLESNSTHLVEVLELAANLADPRLLSTLDEHAASPDMETRELTATALGNGVSHQVTPILRRLIDDDEAEVRAAAIASLGQVGDIGSVTMIGRRLSDRSWTVRRAAGMALDQVGSAGRMVLRQHLDDPDPFARDMARQVLDAAAQRGLPPPPPVLDPLDDINEESDRESPAPLAPVAGPLQTVSAGVAPDGPSNGATP